MAKRKRAFAVNLNNDVEFMLTPEGERAYLAYLSRRGWYNTPLRRGRGKLLRTELWYFMQIFGSAMCMSGHPLVEKNSIKIFPST